MDFLASFENIIYSHYIFFQKLLQQFLIIFSRI